MSTHTTLLERLRVSYPIIQAPMAGGGDTPVLVAAVCNAGGLGSIGAAYLTPAQIIESGRAVRARTTGPFAINLFAPQPLPDLPENVRPALDRMAPYFTELGLPVPSVPDAPRSLFPEQLSASLESGAS